MKHISFFALGTIFALNIGNANAAPLSHPYANSVATRNIGVMQHTIMLNAFNSFDIAPTSPFEKHVVVVPDEKENVDSDMYGKMPMYGEKLTYGEYGDDGTVFLSGRNGGDITSQTPVWINWQHAQDHAHFDGFNGLDSNYDLISLGFADEEYVGDDYVSKFGGFGGLAFAREKDASVMKLSETGEYVGLYYGYHKNGLNIQTAADMGALFNDVESAYGMDKFTNLWLGVAANASYNIVLDEESILQPGLYAGYTWIYSYGYDNASGNKISADNFNMFEISPSLRAITHIAGGWYGAMSARYVFNFEDGGNENINGVSLSDLDLDDYAEYGLSLERTVERLSIIANINRRDGGRTGWNGGINLKYIF